MKRWFVGGGIGIVLIGAVVFYWLSSNSITLRPSVELRNEPDLLLVDVSLQVYSEAGTLSYSLHADRISQMSETQEMTFTELEIIADRQDGLIWIMQATAGKLVPAAQELSVSLLQPIDLYDGVDVRAELHGRTDQSFFSRQLTYFPSADTLIAVGEVTIMDRGSLYRADELVVDLNAGEFDLRAATGNSVELIHAQENVD